MCMSSESPLSRALLRRVPSLRSSLCQARDLPVRSRELQRPVTLWCTGWMRDPDGVWCGVYTDRKDGALPGRCLLR